MDFCNSHWLLMDKLRRLISITEQQAMPFCNKYSITPLQLNILFTLHFRGSQTISSLAEYCCIARGNNSALCKKLEKEGLLMRQRDTQDERQVLVSLTPKASAIIADYGFFCAEENEDLKKICSCAEFKGLLNQLDKTIGTIEKTVGGKE